MIIYKPKYVYLSNDLLPGIVFIEKSARDNYGYDFRVTQSPYNNKGIEVGSRSPLIITFNSYFCYYDSEVEEEMNKLIKDTGIKKIEIISYDEFLIKEIVE